MTEEPENPIVDVDASRASLIEAISASLDQVEAAAPEAPPLEATPDMSVEAQPVQEAAVDAVVVETTPEAENEAVVVEPAPEVEAEAAVVEPAPAAAETQPEAETPAQVPEVASASPSAEVASIDVGPQPKVALWPFITYGLVWIAFAGVVVWQLLQIPADVAVFEDPMYQLTVLGGLALACCGPLVALAAWFSAWGTPGSTKGGLFLSALVRGAVFTFCGVTLWWLALIIIDQLRLGRVL